MTRSRSLLHLNKLDDFRAFCESRGWSNASIKGPYERLRMTRSGSSPLIVYARSSATEHLTVHGVAEQMARAFLRERSRSAVAINLTTRSGQV